MPIPHPAKFAQAHLDAIVEILGDNPDLYVLDPFAGIGTVHQLPYRTIGVEIEPDWAKQHPDTIVGNAVNTPYDRDTFDAIVTSPCFGNRMADHHEAKDDSNQNGYGVQADRVDIHLPLHTEKERRLRPLPWRGNADCGPPLR